MATEQLSLAPAAGTGIGKIIADRLVADQEFVDALINAFIDGLHATSQLYSKEAKDWVPVIDYKTRVTTAMAILAHMEGEPVKRIIHQHLGAPGGAGEALLDELAGSAALREAMRRTLAKAERLAEKSAAAKEVVDVD
jgi:hypothetical protein